MTHGEHWPERMNGRSFLERPQVTWVGGMMVALLLATFYIVVQNGAERAHATRELNRLEATRQVRCGLLADVPSQSLCRVTAPLGQAPNLAFAQGN